jgi:hypothetical protein
MPEKFASGMILIRFFDAPNAPVLARVNRPSHVETEGIIGAKLKASRI